MAGRRTSVYLSEPVADALKASGRPLAEVIAAGLGIQPEPLAGTIRAAVAEATAPVLAELAAIRSALARLPAGAALASQAAGCPHSYPVARTVAGVRVCKECG